MEALLLQTGGRFTKGLVDARKRLFARNRMIGKQQIEVDRKSRHVSQKEINGRAALERERIVNKHKGRDPRQQPSALSR